MNDSQPQYRRRFYTRLVCALLVIKSETWSLSIATRVFLLILFALALCVEPGFGQITEKQRKASAEAAKKEREKRMRSVEVDIRKVASFPQDFLNKQVRAKSVRLSELRQTSENGQIFYLVEIHAGSDLIFGNYLNPNSVSFFVTENNARTVFDYYERQKAVFGAEYPAHIIFTMKQIDDSRGRLYVAHLDCIEFIGFLNKVWGTVGKCD